MPVAAPDPGSLLSQSLRSGRIHSAYLLSGPEPVPRERARAFARALVCEAQGEAACERCEACRKSGADDDALALDGSGKKGPLYRHIGDHPDLFWIERGDGDTRVRIAQVRALQSALRLRGSGAGRRVAVCADAEWLNPEAQNALLRLLEEPPPRTALVLVARGAASLLATIRSRCQRVRFPESSAAPHEAPEQRELVDRLTRIGGLRAPELLDWAEEYRGARGDNAEEVLKLIAVASSWLRERAVAAAQRGGRPERELGAFSELSACRKSLVQRNANPQMVAERALFALRGALAK
jgi:DNA polymerase-3 subunit delta'